MLARGTVDDLDFLETMAPGWFLDDLWLAEADFTLA